MIDLAHKYGARLMLHSCGSTRAIWPDFVDIGLDIYDTVQPEAAGMIPEELAAEFGRHICLHGTISTQKTLPFGTPVSVAQEVRKRIDSFGARGGLIVAPSHNIQPDTPIENLLAMYRAVGCLN
jgi:uroporphyrinogen decarboxylase